MHGTLPLVPHVFMAVCLNKHRGNSAFTFWTVCFLNFTLPYYLLVSNYVEGGAGSVVGIATGYRLDGLGIESRWWQDFLRLSRPALGPTQPPVQWVLGLSQG